MKTVKAAIGTPDLTDLKVLRQLASADNVCLGVVTVIAATVLGGWTVPAVGSALPDGWSLMKANTALALLLCTASLALTKPTRSPRLLPASRACACVVVFLAVAALFEYWSGHGSGLDMLLAADSGARPGRMAVQTAFFLVLLGASLLVTDRTRQDLLGHALDVSIAALGFFSIVLVAGFIFDADVLLGQASVTTIAPQTLVCLVMLTLAQTGRRAPHGYFSVLAGAGIGSQFARIALPLSQTLVLVLMGVEGRLVTWGHLAFPYASALTAASMAGFLLLLVIWMARRINGLETDLRDLALVDELTGLHNRRSFYLLGEQALLTARRVRTPLTVFFFDADGLKQINDTLGHDVGSELLRDITTLLRTTFRSSDVVARLGGDEFAAITQGHQDEVAAALRRLEDAIEVANGAGGKPYRIELSAGGATTEPQSNEPFAGLVDRADAAMYQDKRQKRAAREAGGAARELLQPIPTHGAAGIGR